MSLFWSCKNDLSDEIVSTSHSKTLAQYLFLDVFRQALSEVPEFVADGAISGAAITLSSDSTFETSTYPKTVTINYGEVNQQDSMGMSRRGKILVKILSDKILKGDFKVTFDKFYLNDTRMLGELSSSYLGSLTGDDYKLILGDSCKISNGNGTMSFSSVMTMKMIEGSETFDPYDDIYTLTEESNGQDFKGRSYSAASITDYTLDFSCRWMLVAGVGDVNPTDIAAQELDLGSGSCDGVVTVKVLNDESISFQVK